MDKEELPSDSDQSDEDYVPEGADTELPSEEESDGDEEQLDTDQTVNTTKTRKRSRKTGKKVTKKVKTSPIEEPETPKPTELDEEQKKKRVDDLWASFLVGTDPPRPKTVTNGTKIDVKVPDKPKPATTTVTKVFEFAGEEVKVTKEVAIDSLEARLKPSPGSSSSSSTSTDGILPRGRGRGMRGGGLSAVLGQLGGKKNKISTLEKSKLDWDSFKQNEGISEEIEHHNKGKSGYLERQDFLQRTDLRQFEIEKELRTTTRRSNR